MRLDDGRALRTGARPALDGAGRSFAAPDAPAPPAAQRGLRTHLVALVLLALAPALLLGAATTWQLGQAYRRSAEAGLAGTTKALATALDREVEIASTALATLAASPRLQSGDVAAAYPEAAAVGQAFGGWVALLDADLRQAFNTREPLGAPLPVGAGDPFVARALATGEVVASDLFLGATARRPVVAVFRPLPLGAAGAAPGERRVLLLAFGPERLSALLERQEFGAPGAFAVLTDGAGRVVARSSEHGRFVGQPAPAWYVEGARDREGGFLRGASLAGPEMVLAFRRLEEAPSWTVAVTLPSAAHQAEWRRPALGFGFGAVFAIALGAALAAVLARRLHRPLRALARDAESLDRGGAPAAATEAGRVAEFEALRRALHRSSAALRGRAVAEGRAAAAEEAAAELREAARRRELLVAELNHRVKNTLATVQSLTAQTLKGAGGDPERFSEHLSARLRTLARAHDLLSRVDWRPAEFGALARAALAPWLETDAGGRPRRPRLRRRPLRGLAPTGACAGPGAARAGDERGQVRGLVVLHGARRAAPRGGPRWRRPDRVDRDRRAAPGRVAGAARLRHAADRARPRAGPRPGLLGRVALRSAGASRPHPPRACPSMRVRLRGWLAIVGPAHGTIRFRSRAAFLACAPHAPPV